MVIKKSTIYLISAILFTIATPLQAGKVNGLNNFISGTPAVAAEVNGNFTVVKTAVDDNDSRIIALESMLTTLQSTMVSQASTISVLQSDLTAANATIAALQSDLTVVANSNVMDLNNYLTVSGTKVTFSGINLQIDNGMGFTNSINGLGNLIIGYDEANTLTTLLRCSLGDFNDQISCESNSGIWSHSHKTGSHYLVLGTQNNYSRNGGLVAGYRNFVTGNYSSVNGGTNNTASNVLSSVSGGGNNTASGAFSNVSGGGGNTASGSSSSISGGTANIAEGLASSVSGGGNNTASGSYSSISGGRYNITSSDYSSVSGGRYSTSSGAYSSVSGGNFRSATGLYDWQAGALFEDF